MAKIKNASTEDREEHQALTMRREWLAEAEAASDEPLCNYLRRELEPRLALDVIACNPDTAAQIAALTQELATTDVALSAAAHAFTVGSRDRVEALRLRDDLDWLTSARKVVDRSLDQARKAPANALAKLDNMVIDELRADAMSATRELVGYFVVGSSTLSDARARASYAIQRQVVSGHPRIDNPAPPGLSAAAHVWLPAAEREALRQHPKHREQLEEVFAKRRQLIADHARVHAA